MFPIPMNSKTPYAVLMVWVDQSSFEALISPVQQHVNECTLIYDRTGTRVFSMYNEQLGLSDDELDNVIQRAERENKRCITLGGREYALASSARGSNSWRCVSLLPLDSFWDDIVVIRRNLVLINLLLIAATMFVITVTVRRYYQPIRNLANRTEQFVGNQSGNNELEMIHHALDHLNTKAAMMQSKYMDSIPVLKEHVLYALVSGQYETISAFNEAAADVPLHFTQPYLSVALIHPDMKETVDVLDYLEGLASGSAPRPGGLLSQRFFKQRYYFCQCRTFARRRRRLHSGYLRRYQRHASLQGAGRGRPERFFSGRAVAFLHKRIRAA